MTDIPARRRHLLALLAEYERLHAPLTIREMANGVQSTIATVHRDLMHLLNEGLVVHHSGEHGSAWRANLPMIVEGEKEAPNG